MSDKEQKDFSDAEDVTGDEFLDESFEDESWEEDLSADAEDESGAAAPVKKKSSKFNLILVLCAVLGGGGFVYMKMGGNPAPVPAPVEAQQSAPQQVAQAPDKQASPANEPEVKNRKEEEWTGGFLNNPESFDKVEKIRESMQFEEYAEGTDTEAWDVAEEDAPAAKGAAPVDEKAGIIKEEPLTPLPPVAEMPAVVAEAAAETSGSLPAPTPVMEQPGVNPPALPAAKDVLISTTAKTDVMQVPSGADGGNLQASIDAIGKQLTDLAGRLGALETAVEGLEVPTGSGQEIADIKTALTKLEKKVDGLGKPAAIASAKSSGDKEIKTSRVTAVSAPGKKQATVMAWVLKSAQPGKAIVSKAGQGETYAIAVGDKLEGIGKITSVEQQNGLWVVQGSAGKITQ